MRKALVVVGSLNADLYVEISALPRPGETISGQNAAMRPGGKGANQAAAAARLGYPTQLIGQLGNDAFAPLLTQALVTAGVDCTRLVSSAGDSGQALILLQEGGENSIIIVGGANQRWNGLAPAAQDAIRQGGALLLQREIPEAVSLAAARVAHAAGVPVVLDAGGIDAPLTGPLLAATTCLSPNETELARLTGLPTDSEAQLVLAATTLQRAGVAQVLVKLGARGALLLAADGSVTRQAALPVTVVDTTGAGDCFTAAYTVATLEGQGPAACLAFACAAAACCVQVKGAMPSMPSRAQVEQLLNTHPHGVPRRIAVMMRPGLRIGLQEWSVCVEALRLGRSCVLIRKGGIHEPRGGLFTPEHERFALLPSYLHQAAERLHPQYGGAFLAQSLATSQPGLIPVTVWAEVARVWKCTSLARVQALGEEVPWSSVEIATRFAYRAQPFLFVLALRVQRLPDLLALPDRASYGGCRSWISLEDPVPTEGSTPVISDADWTVRLAHLDSLLGAHSESP